MGKLKGKSEHRMSIRDSGGFVQIPKTTIGALLKQVSFRGVMVFQAIALRFNGYNNGKIVVSMREIAETIGSSDHGANARAITELVQAGFVWIGATYAKGSRLAREYGLTFISSGEGGKVPATHAYLETRQQKRCRKIGTREAASVEDFLTDWKRSVEDFHTAATETCGVEDRGPVVESTTHIVSHGEDDGGDQKGCVVSTSSKHGALINTTVIELNQLRALTRRYLESAPYGAQSHLANDAHIQPGTLSKFIGGRGLPEAQRMPLQLALGRRAALQVGAD